MGVFIRRVAVFAVLLATGCGGSSSSPPSSKCTVSTDCPGVDSECAVRACLGGACGVSNTPAGTAIPVQTPGDCRENRCDGSGNVVSVVYDADLPAPDATSCTLENCSGGVPAHTPVAIDTACSDAGGTVCNASGGCVQCNTLGQCPGLDGQCQARSCSTGTCGLTYAAPGTACTEGGGTECDGFGTCVATPSGQIAAARAAADGTCSLPVAGAVVTYVKPAAGGEPAGFFVQGGSAGPALFVAVDAATLSPIPMPGDRVTFTITEMTTVAMLREASAIAAFARTGAGVDLSAWVQEVTNAPLDAQIDAYESELVTADAMVTGAFGSAGAGMSQAVVATSGVPAGTNLRLRILETLRDANDVVQGCNVRVGPSPLWRFNATVQLSAWTAAELTLSNCPAPTVVSAVALSATSVRVTFDRHVASASVVGNGSQFTFTGGLAAAAAVVSGREVVVTTSSQVAGTSYTVTVASTVTDDLGVGVGAPDAATFAGFETPAAVRINELNANVAGGCDLVELRVVAAGSLRGFRLTERTGSAAAGELAVVFPLMSLQKNDIVVVHMNSGSTTCNPGGATVETAGPAEQPAATFPGNYDTAWDLWSADAGLTATDNVLTLFDASGNMLDAVLLANLAAGTAAAASETAAAAAAVAGQWHMVGGGVPAGGFVDDAFRANAALDLDGTGTTAGGTSIQRLDDTDDNDKEDWNSATVTVQPQTFGVRNVGQSAL